MSSRITRSNREIGLRRTRKRSHNQVGGASFYLPRSKYFKEQYYVGISGEWFKKLKEVNVSHESITKILKLFTYKNSDPAAAPAPAPAAPPAAPPDLSEAWLVANKYRNPIMKVGLEIIMNELGISGEMTEEKILQQITGFNTDSASSFVKILKELFTDLEKILTLDHPKINLDTPHSTGPYSKLELMFKDDDENTAQELSLLLLYPMRIQNLLIQSVAVVVLMLQKEGEMDKIKKNLNNNILKTILVNKWTNYSLILCMSQTNDNIRDNFAEGLKPTTIEEVKEFWESFVDQLNQVDISLNKTENLNINLGILACEYAKHLKDSSGNDFLDSNKLTGLNEYKLSEKHKKGLPDIFDNIPLFNKLLPESILFLKQLECAVELARAKLSTP